MIAHKTSKHRLYSLVEKMMHADPSYLDCPEATFQYLLEQPEFIDVPNYGTLVCRYNTLSALMTSRDFGRGEMYRLRTQEQRLSLVELMRKHWLLYKDQPDHTRLKRLTLKALNSYLDTELKSKVQEVSSRLIEKINFDRPFDFYKEYAYPLPLMIILDLLGLEGSFELFHQAAQKINRTFEPNCSTEVQIAGDLAVRELKQFLEARLANPSNIVTGSLMHRLYLAFTEEGKLESYDELLFTIMLLLIAGHETTSAFTSLALITLVKHPDAYNYAREHPDSIPQIGEEILRLEAPVQMARRVALKDTSLCGRSFKHGEMVTGIFAAANYDPNLFDNPTVIRLGRPHPHVSFGKGAHRCLGADLAAMEKEVVLDHIIRKFPKLTFAGPIVYKPTIVLRGVDALPVKYQGAINA